MTKDEIKKALECCEKYAYCKDCPCYTYCEHELHKGALALITEQEKEIEQLKSDFKQLQTNAEILAWGVRDLNHENYELTEKVKQVQADTINAIVKYCETPSHWNELKDCKLWGGKSDDLRVFLNGIFKENNNEKA